MLQDSPSAQRNLMAEDSSDDVERTSLTAGKIPDVASAGPFKRPGVLISAVGTHVAAVALLAMMWHTLKKALSPEAPLLTWRTFPLHPFLMTLAFGFLSPVAAAAWRWRTSTSSVSPTARSRSSKEY